MEIQATARGRWHRDGDKLLYIPSPKERFCRFEVRIQSEGSGGAPCLLYPEVLSYYQPPVLIYVLKAMESVNAVMRRKELSFEDWLSVFRAYFTLKDQTNDPLNPVSRLLPRSRFIFTDGRQFHFLYFPILSAEAEAGTPEDGNDRHLEALGSLLEEMLIDLRGGTHALSDVDSSALLSAVYQSEERFRERFEGLFPDGGLAIAAPAPTTEAFPDGEDPAAGDAPGKGYAEDGNVSKPEPEQKRWLPRGALLLLSIFLLLALGALFLNRLAYTQPVLGKALSALCFFASLFITLYALFAETSPFHLPKATRFQRERAAEARLEAEHAVLQQKRQTARKRRMQAENPAPPLALLYRRSDAYEAPLSREALSGQKPFARLAAARFCFGLSKTDAHAALGLPDEGDLELIFLADGQRYQVASVNPARIFKIDGMLCQPGVFYTPEKDARLELDSICLDYRLDSSSITSCQKGGRPHRPDPGQCRRVHSDDRPEPRNIPSHQGVSHA